MPLRPWVGSEPVSVQVEESYTPSKLANKLFSAVNVNPSVIFTVPTGMVWFVNWAMWRIVTNANVVDRFPLFNVVRQSTSGNSYSVWRVAGPTTPASNERYVMMASFSEHNDDAALFGGSAIQVHTRNIPPGPFLAGDTLTFGLNGAQGTDYMDVHLVVSEVIQGDS